MIFKIILTLFFLICITTHNSQLTTHNLFAQMPVTQGSDQQISDFSLAGFGQKGEKSWDITGKTADIFDDLIKLKDIVGYLYREEEDVKLTADKGDFNKKDGAVHLEQNVVVTTSKGARMTTDSLDWDRKNQVMMTEDKVNIEKENMVTTASGATGKPDLHKVTLQRDVQVEIKPLVAQKGTQDKTVITCDGQLEIDYEKNIAVFNDNVKVDRGDLLIFSDVMDVYFLASGENKVSQSDNITGLGTKIEKIICRGNVRIVRGENESFSDEAVYSALNKKIVLIGKPKLVINSTEGLGASFGN